MQVTEHIIAVPVANQLDDVTANSGTEECYGTCGAEVMKGDVPGLKSQV